MRTLLIVMIAFFALKARAQVSKVSLQASGLTCSMCSKAVLTALQKVPFVDKVQVNIKNQEYHLGFKEGAEVDFDALQKAVDDAGFGVAKFTVTATLDNQKLQKDEHLLIGNQYFHFLNGADKQLNGASTFTVVDKKFTSAKEFNKYSSLSKMECVQTGRMAACCPKENAGATGSRVYHVVI